MLRLDTILFAKLFWNSTNVVYKLVPQTSKTSNLIIECLVLPSRSWLGDGVATMGLDDTSYTALLLGWGLLAH